jgi:hypothetical protein
MLVKLGIDVLVPSHRRSMEPLHPVPQRIDVLLVAFPLLLPRRQRRPQLVPLLVDRPHVEDDLLNLLTL